MFTSVCTMAYCLTILSNGILGAAAANPGAPISTKQIYQYADEASCQADQQKWQLQVGVTTTSRWGDVTVQSATCAPNPGH